MRCKHGTQDWIVCSFCMAGIPRVDKPDCGTFDTPMRHGFEGFNGVSVEPRGENDPQQIVLKAGTVVLVHGAPMRLTTDAIVESHMNNFRAAGLNGE